MNKPKLMINVIMIHPDNKSIFVGKRVEDMKINFVSGKLKYGEEFNDCSKRLMKEEVGLTIEDNDRLKFVCSYNMIDKEKGLHFVCITFYITLDDQEIKWLSINKYTFSSYVFATLEDIINYKEESYSSLQVFMSKFNITSIDDIKNIISN